MKSPHAAALACILMLALAGFAAAAPAAPVAPAPVAPGMPTADELRASMLASDSILVAHVDVTLVETPDSTGQPKTTWNTKRQFVNQVRSPWMKRFVANFLPPGMPVRSQLCPTPRPVGGSERPWMVTALWINKSGRGQVYLDFSSLCGIAGLAGTQPAGVDFNEHADSLFALFREALFADTLLKTMRLDAPPPVVSAAPGTTVAPMPAPGGRLRIEDNVGVSKPPEPLQKVAPVYPKVAREAGIEGTVVVIALVDQEGHVAKAQIQESIALLDIAALAAVRKWTFKPARTVEGSPIEARVLVPVTFTLQAGAPKPK
jgi:protein TonB